ncbi:MAG: hypothetical protein INQ03_26045 [Candidatus Heimdallarchaeota archaeon]|nr:hypothetical protein [Candidatus Heimdallarchaeota archaeon]
MDTITKLITTTEVLTLFSTQYYTANETNTIIVFYNSTITDYSEMRVTKSELASSISLLTTISFAIIIIIRRESRKRSKRGILVQQIMHFNASWKIGINLIQLLR